MTDESVIISLVKLKVKKLKLGGFNVRDNLDEEIMISNLPLLFADGYPTCLEKVTLVSIFIFFLGLCYSMLPVFTGHYIRCNGSKIAIRLAYSTTLPLASNGS
jgi:hypothetical protein